MLERMSTTTVGIDSGAHRARVLARRDALVAGHLSLVEGIARALARSLPPCFDTDDLIGAGNLALLHCATRYRPGAHGGVPFSAFARARVRGAMIDSVRGKRWTENTRPGLDQIYRVAHHADSGKELFTGESQAMQDAATLPTPDEAIDAHRLAGRLAEAVSWLPESQQRVLREYYGADEPTLAEVAARMAVSTQTARKVRAAAVQGLRARFRIRPAA